MREQIANEELCSTVLLDIAHKSFEHEHDRAKRLERKASVFIVIIALMLNVLVGCLDLQHLNEIWKMLCIYLFGICAIVYLVSIIYFIKVLELKTYRTLKYDVVFGEGNLECYKVDMEEALVKEYGTMLVSIEKGNNEKAMFYDMGTVFAIVGIIFNFALIFINVVM